MIHNLHRLDVLQPSRGPWQLSRGPWHTTIMQISSTFLARFGRGLLNLSATLFNFILGLYTSWMAAASTTYTVPCRTLTSIFQDHNVNAVALLKVDVEGAEVSVRPLSSSTSHPQPWLYTHSCIARFTCHENDLHNRSYTLKVRQKISIRRTGTDGACVLA